MTELGIVKLHEKLINKEITSEDLVKESLAKSHKFNETCNAFVTRYIFLKGISKSGIPWYNNAV